MADPRLTTSFYPADTSEPVLDMTVGDLLRACARDAGEATALVELTPPGSPSLSGAGSTERSWTYRELLEEAERCAHWLLERFAPGDRITVWAPNIPEWVILQWGAGLAGLVLVTANPALRADELRYVLAQSRSAGLFHTEQWRGTDMTAIAGEATSGIDRELRVFCFADWEVSVRGWNGARGALPDVDPGDPAQIQYTSGTTGTPKGALLHHRGLVTNARYYGVRAKFADGGTLVSAMPLFHTGGCGMAVLGCAHMRGRYGLLQIFDPELALRAVENLRATVFTGVPTMLIAMLSHPALAEIDTGGLAVVVSGGASVPPELVRRVERTFGCRFTTVYGQTELSPVVSQTSLDDEDTDKAETVGRPLWNVEVKIADVRTNEPVPVGEEGEICARGYQQMLEYFDMPDATAETVDADGWLHTGDLGTMDDRGYMRITGRLKDMIIRGGENIYPREIEEVLFDHPRVLDAAVVGIPDERYGEVVVAVVRAEHADDPPTAQELRAHCRARLAPHKTPIAWYLTDEWPLTGSGKIRKFHVADVVRDGGYAALPASPARTGAG